MHNETKLIEVCRQQQNGFSLVEMLVSVAIIAALISILLPSIEKANDVAEQAVCLSHVREVHKGLKYYGADNNRLIPPHAGWTLKAGVSAATYDPDPQLQGPQRLRISYSDLIAPYLYDTILDRNKDGRVDKDIYDLIGSDVFRCPSLSHTRAYRPNGMEATKVDFSYNYYMSPYNHKDSRDLYERFLRHYGHINVHSNASSPLFGTPNMHMIRASTIKNHSAIFLAEGGYGNGEAVGRHTYNKQLGETPDPAVDWPIEGGGFRSWGIFARHLGGYNTLRFDGSGHTHQGGVANFSEWWIYRNSFRD